MEKKGEKSVLGISSSPIPNSNTDKAVKAVLQATGCKTEFIKLSDYIVAPCRGCLSCAKTNKCVINDDGALLAQKVKNADAIVIGCFTSYSSLDARAKAFLERLYQLRHQKGYLRNKVGSVVATSPMPEGLVMRIAHVPPSRDMAIKAIKYFMSTEGMNFVGAVRVYGNPPCIRCGFGDECQFSGVKNASGGTVASWGVKCFDNQPKAVQAAQVIGQKIAQELLKS
jgi:multimeric flavodoxin WrbA